jgi:acyl carrier protein
VLQELEIDVDGVRAATRLREDLAMDSTELVEACVALERSTRMKIDAAEVFTLRTVGELVTYVEGLRPTVDSSASERRV